MRETTVMIVDDHPLFSKGLAALLASQPMYSVVGEADRGAAAMELLFQKKPNLAIVGLNLRDTDGLDLIKNLKAHDKDIVVLALSMYDERYYCERVLGAGAQGYVMKNQPGETVLKAIKTVMSGKIYKNNDDDQWRSARAKKSGKNKDMIKTVQCLSTRQFQIFSLFGKGLGTIEVSAKLNISTKTVDAHKELIKEKLHCNTSQDLRQMAVEWNSLCAATT